MNLDTSTLLVADAFVTALSSALLFFVAAYNRDAPGTVWWGVANLCVAATTAIVAVGHGLPDLGPRILVAVLLGLAGGCYWAAARRCDRQSVPPVLVLAGAALWLLVLPLPHFVDSPTLQMALAFGLSSIYSFAAAVELWRGRAERLAARWPLIGILLIDGTVSAIGAVEAYFGDLSALKPPPMNDWFGLVYFEAFLLTVGGAALVILLGRERTELQQRKAATIDALTDVATRGAFMAHAAAALAMSQQRDEPLSLVLFDLDHFKRINDTFGHAMGDVVLKEFAATASRVMRTSDRLGRIGGEEFAMVLPGADASAAFVIADRIRDAFATACRVVEEAEVFATVSAGVATAHPNSTLDGLLRESDELLYQAKAQGRNLVRRAGRKDGQGAPGTVVRIA